MEQQSSLKIPGLQAAMDLQPSPRPPPCSMQKERGLLLPIELDVIYEHVPPIDIPFFSFLSLRKRDKNGSIKTHFHFEPSFLE